MDWGAQAIERAREHRRASISERCDHGTDISEGSLIGILAWSGTVIASYAYSVQSHFK